MKILFNDLSELEVQAIERNGDRLEVKTINATPAQLRDLFEDPAKTRKMKKVENGSVAETYEGYTTFYCTSEYPGVIYGVVNYKPAATPEAEKEILKSAVKVAKIQAQDLPDENAIDVQNLYPEWDGNGKEYASGFKVNYEGTLYKCLQKHTSQEGWNPVDAPSLWAKVLIEPGTIPEWEQPSSTNPYMKGDQVTHNGKTWESLIDNNVWEPGTVGTETLWKEVS
ncbi:MAG: hypothetical protein K6B42_07560 [Clostridia bacterium]|nr:hypothetical protein [Clostridia bacterium]